MSLQNSQSSGAQSRPRATMAHVEQKTHEPSRTALSEQATHVKSAAIGVQQHSHTVKEQAQGVLETARKELGNVITTAEQTAKQYLPESVAAYIPGEPRQEHAKPHKDWHPSELEQRRAAEKHEERSHKQGPVGGVGSLPGTPNEEGVAKLPEERLQEAKAAQQKKGPTGGVGSLPGTPGEEGVAKLPEERAQEAAAAKVDQRLLAEQARQDRPSSGLRHEVAPSTAAAVQEPWSQSQGTSENDVSPSPDAQDSPLPAGESKTPQSAHGIPRHVPASEPERMSGISAKAPATTAVASDSSDYRQDLSKPYPDEYHPAQLHPLPKPEREETSAAAGETTEASGSGAGEQHAAGQGSPGGKGFIGKIKEGFAKLKGEGEAGTGGNEEKKKQKF